MAATIDPWDGVTAAIVHADCYPTSAEWRIAPQPCPYDDFFLVWKGRGWIEIGDERFDARADDLFIIRRGDVLAAGHDPRSPVLPLSTGFHLRRQGGADPIRHLALPRRLRLLPDEAAALRALFLDLLASRSAATPTASLAATGALLRLAAEVLRLAEALPVARRSRAPSPPADDDGMVAAVQAWIDQHLAERLTLPGLARAARLSPAHFVTVFRRRTGATPMRWLQARRIEAARVLLAAGERPIEEVARAVGFPDPFHFSRVFRRIVSIAPRDYRASLRHPFAP